MTITINESQIVQTAKTISILLVIAAVFTFLGLSSKIFRFSETNPVMYEISYNRLSIPGKGVLSSLKKTGEVQSKVLGPRPGIKSLTQAWRAAECHIAHRRGELGVRS